MSIFIERQFADRLGPYVRNFKRKTSDLWNFSCYSCGDSKTDKRKARGYVYRVQNKLLYRCHNCGIGTTLGVVLKSLDEGLYKEFLTEKFKDEKSFTSEAPKQIKTIRPDVDYTDQLNLCVRASMSEISLEFLRKRQIPQKYIDKLYFTEYFEKFVNTISPGKFPDINIKKPRIVIPFLCTEGKLHALQARSLVKDDKQRYITIITNENKPKIFGLNKVNTEKEVVIVEGPFDSMFLDNSLAMAGADVNMKEINISQPVYCYDNEPRSKEILNRISNKINNGDKVVIWPDSIKEKDINDMVLAGHNPNDIIRDNTYMGLNARMKFNSWRKV